MKDQLTIFESAQFGQIRISKSASGEPLFCLADVCRALELTNPRQVKTTLNQKGVISNDTLTKGGVQKLIFITEPNLYKCIFQSRKKEAEKFQDWVCAEVLQSIRTSGSYTALLAKSRENREDDDDLMSYPTIEEYFKQFVPLDYFIDMLMALMKDCTEMADWLNSENRDKVYHRVSVLLTFTKVLQATYRRGTFA